MTELLIEIYDRVRGGRCTAALSSGELDIGRQLSENNQSVGPLLQLFRTGAGQERINITPTSDVTISRDQLKLRSLATGRVEATRKANGVPMEVDGVAWPGGTTRTIGVDSLLTLAGRFELRVLAANSQLQSLAQPTLAPGRSWPKRAIPALDAKTTLEAETLADWFQQITSVLESATNSEEFFANAAGAMVQLLRLDSGRVLLAAGNEWQPAAASIADWARDAPLAPSSARVLERMAAAKTTLWEVPSDLHDFSLEDMQAIVAAPILDRQGNVIGALYGDRRGHDKGQACGINRLEAMLVRMLACGVAAGLARLEQQKAAAEARVRFEQFFTEDLSRHLAAQPDLLTGRDEDVSVLFCDIRGFSRISNALRSDPAALVAWLSEVMSVLSDCVVAEEGVLVDYIGDELMAMWGAPAQQPDHATRACRAAVAMVGKVAELSPLWKERLGESFSVGIGINSGRAFVGNTGSRRKFKYGPLGDTVNMASRVQGATKHFGSQLIMTSATRKLLGDEFLTRRLRRVTVVNIAEPVELHELFVTPGDAQRQLQSDYEAALAAYDSGQLAASLGILGRLLGTFPNDLPARLLLSHAAQALVNPQHQAGLAWELPSK